MIETHPLQAFLPENSRILILGSFPPQKHKWGMNFFYPNFNNDFWRILGLVFFEQKDYFLQDTKNSFDLNKITKFLSHQKIAMADSAYKVIRLNNNASDKFLQVVEPLNFNEIFTQIPQCRSIITTGTKSFEIVQENLSHPNIDVYKAPSSSRAYPLPLEKKAEIYRQIFNLIASNNVSL